MIVDHISNRARYYCLGDNYRIALDYFANIDEEPFDKANIALPDSPVIVKARPMMTKPINACTFEAHHRFADIHFVAYGQEQIGYADVRKLREISYNEETDAAAMEGVGDRVTLDRGYFMITLPQDGHMPCIAPGEPASLGKMIAKIPVEE